MSCSYSLPGRCLYPRSPSLSCVCPILQCFFVFSGLGKIMASSEDWDELLWAWQGFRDEVGIPNKPLYKEYVALANEAARLNGRVPTVSVL